MKNITKNEWKRKQTLNQVSIIKRQKYILSLTNKGTSLVPVKISK